ncbi:hypothetical protein SDC9_148355 [bioreactor metagenome]|uniref:Uncharacterized protein n=1 Tax=bioreactor metagenome TaxID=1076179 RepID=A0A645EIQ9_9ZZZZ
MGKYLMVLPIFIFGLFNSFGMNNISEILSFNTLSVFCGEFGLDIQTYKLKN